MGLDLKKVDGRDYEYYVSGIMKGIVSKDDCKIIDGKKYVHHYTEKYEIDLDKLFLEQKFGSVEKSKKYDYSETYEWKRYSIGIDGLGIRFAVYAPDYFEDGFNGAIRRCLNVPFFGSTVTEIGILNFLLHNNPDALMGKVESWGRSHHSNRFNITYDLSVPHVLMTYGFANKYIINYKIKHIINTPFSQLGSDLQETVERYFTHYDIFDHIPKAYYKRELSDLEKIGFITKLYQKKISIWQKTLFLRNRSGSNYEMQEARLRAINQIKI